MRNDELEKDMVISGLGLIEGTEENHEKPQSK
jgi:hypothetical protein